MKMTNMIDDDDNLQDQADLISREKYSQRTLLFTAQIVIITDLHADADDEHDDDL